MKRIAILQFTLLTMIIVLNGKSLLNTVFGVEQNYSFVTKWGSVGELDGQFVTPGGMTIDSQGNIYVVDSGNSRIQKFTKDGMFISKWGSNSSSTGQLYHPDGISHDTVDNIYVVDSGNSRIQKFSNDGKFVAKWYINSTYDPMLNTKNDVAVDSLGNVYVVESQTQSITKFDPDGKTIMTLTPEQFDYRCCRFPESIVINSSNFIYVLDLDHIFTFSPEGALVEDWDGSRNNTGSQISGAHDIAIDGSDMIYVVESDNNRAQKFTAKGDIVAAWGSEGTADGQFSGPGNIAVDEKGNTYVNEASTGRVQVFSPFS